MDARLHNDGDQDRCNTRDDIFKRQNILNLIEADEAAALLGVSLLTLRKWRRLGGGPAFVKIGRRVAYQVEDIKTWIASTKCRSNADLRTRLKEAAA